MTSEVKTVLCFGDSNTWGAKPVTILGAPERYEFEDRWTTALQRELGDSFRVIPEGLVNRTTVFDDPIEGEHKSAKRYFWPCLESHSPLDLVIIMLGTNDLKPRFGVTAWDIACGAGALLDIVANPPKPLFGGQPKRLLISPPPLGKLNLLAGHFAGGPEKSLGLAENFARAAEMRGVPFLDAGEHIKSSDGDGVHFDPDQHAVLGTAVAGKVREILG